MVFTLVGCGKNLKSSALNKEVKIEGLTFKIENSGFNDGLMDIKGTLKNTTNDDKDVEYVKGTITFIGEDKEEKIIDLLFYFGTTIHKGETLVTSTSIDLDLTNATKSEYEFYSEEE